jgi:broad specificity phosphatase PhoE
MTIDMSGRPVRRSVTLIQPPTNFWLLRHALVEQNARARLYGTLDVPLCPETLLAQTPAYQSLAHHLPRPANWVVTPLCRTRMTADAIIAAGYPAASFQVEPDLVEQCLGDWQGLPHAELPERLQTPAHPFWPLSADERPPGGETLIEVLARVGPAMERLAQQFLGQQVVIVSHGGAIRMAIAHAMGIAAGASLHLAIQNLSVTRLERFHAGWRVVGVNAVAGSGGAFALAL